MKTHLQNLRKKIVYADMRYCFYCKYWGVVNWCNLKNKRVYYNSTCEKWEDGLNGDVE